jgi:hypothetical protein
MGEGWCTVRKLIWLCTLFVLYSTTANATYFMAERDSTLSGRVQNSSAVNYTTARDVTEANSAQLVTAVDGIVGQAYSASTWSVYRSILRFDTSALADDATIDSVLFKVVVSYENNDNAFSTMLIACEDTMSTGYFGVHCFDNFEGYAASGEYTPTILSDSLDCTSVSAGDTLTYRLNAAGKSEINKTGITQFFIVSGCDMGSADPKDGAEPAYREDFLFDADYIYIQVYYNGSGGWYSRQVNGVTPASVNGVSVSNIKSVNGVE